MSKSSSQRQQAQRNDVYSLLPYAYHEAGHAVVGHVIGRLIALRWLSGAEAHSIIREALGEEQGDWRWDVLQADPINQRRTAFAVQRKQLVADFLKGVITEQELDEGMAGIRQERLTILQSTP